MECAVIGLNHDFKIEGDENFTVTIISAGSAAIQSPYISSVTILDDDGERIIHLCTCVHVFMFILSCGSYDNQ